MRAGRPSRRLPTCRRPCARRARTRLILTLPDSIAWLFNIRGSRRGAQSRGAGFRDCAGERQAGALHRPGQDRARGQGASAPLAKIGEPADSRAPPDGAQGHEQAHPPRSEHGVGLVLPQAAGRKGTHRAWRRDPCLLPKARKNAAEIKGARSAHKRDGAAVVRFLAWLDREAPAGRLDEIAAVAQARDHPQRDAGAEGDQLRHHLGRRPERRHRALPRHQRRPTASWSRASCILVDSGAQYLDGTTDITRTVAIGKPTREMQRALHAGAEGPHRHRHGALSRRARAASTSIRSRAARCGRPASTSTTAPATASAAICQCTRGRRASPSAAWSRSSPA